MLAYASFLVDQLDRLCKRYPGGIAVMAVRLGKREGTLRAELKPPVGSTAKLGFDEAVEIMRNCRQVGMPDALAPLDLLEAEFGRQAIALPTTAQLGDVDLVRHTHKLTREFSDVLMVVATAGADQVITDNELREAESQFGELIAAGHQVLERMRAMNAEAKPAHLRAVC
jgi:hypothetical protein